MSDEPIPVPPRDPSLPETPLLEMIRDGVIGDDQLMHGPYGPRRVTYADYTAGGMMTSEPVVLAPDTTVAEALARVRDPDLTPALASLVFVVRPPTATPTGRYLGCVHMQALLREPPANLVSGIVDKGLPSLTPDTSLGALTRYFAAYNLVCGPVVDEENHLLGAVTVDDVLDHLLPHDWRDDYEEPQLPNQVTGGMP